MFVPHYGSAKIQNVSYVKWAELRSIETKQAFIDFAGKNAELFRGFTAENGYLNDIRELLERGTIKKNNDFLYFSELVKSPILRGGGSSIMSWGCWYEDPKIDGVSYARHTDGLQMLDIAGIKEEVPLSYSMRIGSDIFDELKEATLKINGAIFEQCPSKKLIGRADYVLISEGDDMMFGLVDVGESNLTMALTDEIFNAFGIRANMGLLKHYVGNVISESEVRLGKCPETICLVAENQKMIDDMPYEFQALKNALAEQLKLNPCKIDITHKEARDIKDSRYDLWLRSFRQLDDKDTEFWTTGIDASGAIVLDDPRAIPFYKKAEIIKSLEGKLNYLPDSIIIPHSDIIPLSEDTHTLSKEIFSHAKEMGYANFVIKPSEKAPKSSSAYFYNPENRLHEQQMERILRKLIKLRIKNIIVEEAIGNGAIGGHKAEIRVYCMG